MQVTFCNKISMLHTAIYNKRQLYLYPQKPDTVTFSRNNDFLSSPKNLIYEKIEEAIKNNANKLGEGGEAEVYKIPDTNYCVRLDYATIDAYKNNLSFKLSEQDKINHVVAKLGGNSTIMKYIKGTPVATIDMTENEIRKNADDIMRMPVSAFRKLLHQICYAKEHGMAFDCAWGNVIVNSKKQTLTAIDFYASDEYFSSLREINCALAHTDITLEQRKQIAGKILKAGLEELSPGHKPYIKPDNLGFSRFIYNLCRIPVSPKYRDLLLKLLTETENLKLKELHSTNIARELEGKLKVLNCLVKQLFGVI